MTEPYLLKQAKQGDPQAIAAMINEVLQYNGITAHAERQGNHLEILLEAERILNQQELTALIERGMRGLEVESIESVNVSGQQSGAVSPAWTQELLLQTGFDTEKTVPGAEQSRDQESETKLLIKRHLQQAQYFIEDLGNGVNLEMVLIPGGSFVMGAPEEEEESEDSERPQHTVMVQPFCMGKYPITQAQWKAVAALPQVSRELEPNPAGFKEIDRPVEQVSWYEAVEFCDRLSQKTGREYRLPSEAEWEYACRAGTTTPFHCGETITTDLANYDGSYAYGAGSEGTYRGETTPVGSFKVANDFGLYDMHGNVWEWCLDHWHDSYEGAPIDGSAWLSNNKSSYRLIKSQSSYRLLRGGSWYDGPMRCRSAYRVQGVANDRISYTGFRVVCSTLWGD